MRALSVEEIDNLVEGIQALVGARLQEVEVSPQGVGLGFWIKGQPLVWLWFENITWSPVLLPLSHCPRKGKKPLLPLALFLRAHFVGQSLTIIERDAGLGRAIRLGFGRDRQEVLLVTLWPHAGNVVARNHDSQVSMGPVPDLGRAESQSVASESGPTPRSLSQIVEEWSRVGQGLHLQTSHSGARAKAKPPAPAKSEDPLLKEIKRIERALVKVSEEIEIKKGQPYRAVGEWLKSHQDLNVPQEMRAFVDARRSLAWNIENVFHRAKEAERKLVSTLARKQQLEENLLRLQRGSGENLVNSPRDEMKSQKSTRQKDEAGAARFRTVKLASGLEARIGRSAKDNLALLRKAKGWDLWLHLRDFPGSHAVIHRSRGEVVSDEQLRLAGAALVTHSFGVKARQKVNEMFDLIIAECRFVKPIKGSRLGAVTFVNERTIRFRYSQ